MRVVRTLVLTGALLVSAAAISSAAAKPKTAHRKAVKQYITCPITHNQVLKSKAILVKAANGKTTYVCCKDCIAAARKQLMAQK